MYNKRVELEEDDFYLNEQGYRVFTEKYHLKRGYCCKSGCKHCPFGYDKKTDTLYPLKKHCKKCNFVITKNYIKLINRVLQYFRKYISYTYQCFLSGYDTFK